MTKNDDYYMTEEQRRAVDRALARSVKPADFADADCGSVRQVTPSIVVVPVGRDGDIEVVQDDDVICIAQHERAAVASAIAPVTECRSVSQETIEDAWSVATWHLEALKLEDDADGDEAAACRRLLRAIPRERVRWVHPNQKLEEQEKNTEQESVAPTNLEISAIGASMHYLVRAGKVSEAVHDAVMRWLVDSRSTEENSKG